MNRADGAGSWSVEDRFGSQVHLVAPESPCFAAPAAEEEA